MALSVLQGPVQGIRQSSETSGTIGRRGGQISTTHVASFRVAGRSVEFKFGSMPDIQEGDMVTLVGEAKNGTFKTYALRNDQTGAVFTLPVWLVYLLAVCCAGLGVILLIIMIGVIFLGLAVWLVFLGIKYGKATRMLQATPPLLPA